MQFIEGFSSLSVPRAEVLGGEFSRLEIDSNADNPIRNALNAEVFGQPDAVNALASAIMRAEAGFNNPNRPKGVFLFLGPTGVGKTEMSKSLTRFLYPEDWTKHFKRIDCTDYQDSTSINRIKGSSNGYVGYGDPLVIMPDFLDQGGVIVLDEIEKAHRTLFNWLLPVMEEGSATVPLPTDNAAANGGKDSKEITPTTLDFTKSYIILTSNVGADAVAKTRKGSMSIGFAEGSRKVSSNIRETAMRALKDHFSGIPEFLGRIGEKNSIVFNDLGANEYNKILDKFLDKINNGQSDSPILISTTEELRNFLIQESAKGDYGARTLRDKVDRDIVGQAAELKYTGQLKSGMVVADIDDSTEKIFFWLAAGMPTSQSHSVQVFSPAPLALSQSEEATFDD